LKFSVDKAALTKALGVASRVVEKRNTIPILSNVVLRAEGDKLWLQATDLDLEVKLPVAADIEVGGATTVPAQLLAEIARKLAGDTVNFALDSDGMFMSVSAGRSKFKLQCLPETDFPDLTVGQFSNQFEMPAADLRKLISRSQFAISTEETRYYLNGIFFHTTNDMRGELVLRGVATDGHRLARIEVPAPEGSNGMPGVIIPRKTVGEILKLLDGVETVSVEVSDTKIRVRVGDMDLTSKLIDGTFPDYNRVIPQNNNIVAIADTKAISIAADRVATVSSDRGRAVRMTFTSGNLHMDVNNPDSGAAEDDVEIDYDADELQIGFNSRYIQDILANIASKRARISLADAGSPTVIKDEEGDDVLYVLMPMRV
jgi:DNA polymerase-3 subunit beta